MSLDTFLKEIKKFSVSVEIKPGDKRINITGTQTPQLDLNALIDLVDEMKGWEVYIDIEMFPRPVISFDDTNWIDCTYKFHSNAYDIEAPKDHAHKFNSSEYLATCGYSAEEILDIHIENEDFEEAARIRDMINKEE